MSGSTSDPVCARCKGTTSMIWQRDQKGAVICLDCHAAEKAASKVSSCVSTDSSISSLKPNHNHKPSKSSHQVSSSSSSSSLTDVSTGITTRRSTRSHERAKAKQQQQKDDLAKTEAGSGGPEEAENTSGLENQLVKDKSKVAVSDLSKQGSPSNRAEVHITTMSCVGSPTPSSSTVSRRTLRQGQPMPAPESQPYVLTCSSMEHQGVQYEVGDVVSLLDRDGGVYYAILRGFMCDQYANKFTVITWLLPTVPNPNHFDPAIFILVDDLCHSQNLCQLFGCGSKSTLLAAPVASAICVPAIGVLANLWRSKVVSSGPSNNTPRSRGHAPARGSYAPTNTV